MCIVAQLTAENCKNICSGWVGERWMECRQESYLTYIYIYIYIYIYTQIFKSWHCSYYRQYYRPFFKKKKVLMIDHKNINNKKNQSGKLAK